MALSEEEDRTFRRLSGGMPKAQRDLERLDAYYEGIHRLERLGLAVPPELERRRRRGLVHMSMGGPGGADGG